MNRHKSFKELEALWYAKLAAAGFKDIEDTSKEDRPLKSRDASLTVQVMDKASTQPAEGPIISAWPELTFAQEEAFVLHLQFKKACEELCIHGNSKLTPELVESIWKSSLSGNSIRAIAKEFNVFRDIVYRCLVKMRGLMHLLGESLEDKDAVIVTRAYNADKDDAFIHATWRNSLWYDSMRDTFGNHKCSSEDFYKATSRYIRTLLHMPTTVVRIACLSDDADTIAGYSIMSTTNVEWVYVKINYRKQGVARLLIRGFETVSKPRTAIGKAITINKKLKVLNE